MEERGWPSHKIGVFILRPARESAGNKAGEEKKELETGLQRQAEFRSRSAGKEEWQQTEF